MIFPLHVPAVIIGCFAFIIVNALLLQSFDGVLPFLFFPRTCLHVARDSAFILISFVLLSPALLVDDDLDSCATVSFAFVMSTPLCNVSSKQHVLSTIAPTVS